MDEPTGGQGWPQSQARLEDPHHGHERDDGPSKGVESPAKSIQAIAPLVSGEDADHGEHGHESPEDALEQNQAENDRGHRGKLEPRGQGMVSVRLVRPGRPAAHRRRGAQSQDAGRPEGWVARRNDRFQQSAGRNIAGRAGHDGRDDGDSGTFMQSPDGQGIEQQENDGRDVGGVDRAAHREGGQGEGDRQGGDESLRARGSDVGQRRRLGADQEDEGDVPESQRHRLPAPILALRGRGPNQSDSAFSEATIRLTFGGRPRSSPL